MTDATGTPLVPESSVAAESRTAGPSKARRRLILAAGAALPSIYTLSSGAQMAVASTMVCLSKQGTAPVRFTSNARRIAAPQRTDVERVPQPLCRSKSRSAGNSFSASLAASPCAGFGPAAGGG